MVLALLTTASVLLTARPSSAASPDTTAQQAELASLLLRVASQEPEHPSYAPWAKLELVDPRDVIMGKQPAAEGNDTGTPLESAANRLAKAYGLTPAAARQFLAARLWLEPPGGWWNSLPKEQAPRALEAHRAALRAAPGHLAIVASLVAGVRQLSTVPEYEQAVAEALDTAPAPAELALRLARASLIYWDSEFAAYAVSRQPETLPQALEAFGLGGKEAGATTFYLAAYRTLTASKKAPFPHQLAERLVRNLLQQHQPALALNVLKAFPASARQALLSGDWKARDYVYESGLRAQGERIPNDDVRLDIAVALLVSGRNDEARIWYDAVKVRPTAAAPTGHPYEESSRLLKRELLDWHLAPKPGADPFDLLLLGGDNAELGTAGTVLFAQALAPRYPERALTALRWLLREVHDEKQEEYERLRMSERSSFLITAQAELAAGRKDERARLEGLLATLVSPPTVGKAEARDPMAARISTHLATPALQLFSEKVLPRKSAPTGKKARWKPVETKALKLPDGFWPVRAERSAQKVVAVALSQRLDPAGELSGGGYWVLRSEDGGEHWEALYTGLRHHQPYEVEQASPVPLLDGPVLRLAASIRELDERSISFPPVGLTMKREVKGLVVEAPLAALRQDSDGDGLTDVVEDRLLLDPKAADTDGDGTRDGEDALPQVPSVPSEPSADARAQLLSALLFELTGRKPLEGLVTGVPSQGEEADAVRMPQYRAPTSLEDLRYLTMDRAWLRGMRALTMTVALSEEEFERAQLRFGVFFPLNVDVYQNIAGDQALLVWDEGWRGGSFLARREEGRWVLKMRGSWVT